MGRSGAAERLLRVLSWFEGGTLGGLTDAELLERFVSQDETTAELAFAVLMERPGLTLGKVVQRVTAVKCLVFSPDGKTLAAGGASGTLTIWPVDSGD